MNTQSQLARLGLFDSRVPRYTSYPTAPQFSDAVGTADKMRWIETVPEGSRISLYVHIPFCRKLCWFCACRTQGASNLNTVRLYLETLKSEIAMLGRHLAPGITLSRLHWGGGTPTLMDTAMIAELAKAIFDIAPLAAGGEFSVEIDPNEIDEARLDALASVGMTRASIGVQDFDPEIQKIIGRIQTYDVTQSVADGLRARGIESLNADILYGLPNQSTQRIAESVQSLLSLSPDRVALYGYAHVPWMARRQSMIPSDTLPSPEERLALFETARRLFVWDGYAEIGIDHFARHGDGLEKSARSGTLRRNFQGYTNDDASVLIGLGASSISRFPQGYVQNAASTGGYTRDIRAGQFSGARGHRFAGDDLLRGRIIEALMCDFFVDARELVDRHGATPSQLAALFKPVAEAFEGFVDLGPEGLRIRDEGHPLTRMIARQFDSFDLSTAGHSTAV